MKPVEFSELMEALGYKLPKENKMKKDWDLSRLKSATIAPLTAPYEAIPQGPDQETIKRLHPEMFSFDAISVGDSDGQAFIVPLDESSREVAELILKAIAAYKGEAE